jgi:hypothetical protein
MAIDKGREFAIQILQGLGFEVSPIAEGDLKTADLQATHFGDSYCIECKQKGHNLEWEADTRKRIVDGEIVQRTEEFGATNPIAKRFTIAAKQLASSSAGSEQFRCVWIEVVGQDRDLRFNQVICTFYGACLAVEVTREHSPLNFAFYVDPSIAFAHPQIDAVMLTDSVDFCLLLNEFSSRYDKIKQTHLCKKLSTGVLDPAKCFENGIAVALKGDADRSSDENVEAALYLQEGRRIRLIRMKRHSSTICVPQGSEEVSDNE